MNNRLADTLPVAIVKFCLQARNRIAILDSTAGLIDIFGITHTEIIKDSSLAWEYVHPDDQANILQELHASALTMQPVNIRWRVFNPVKGEILVDCKALPEADEDKSIEPFRAPIILKR